MWILYKPKHSSWIYNKCNIDHCNTLHLHVDWSTNFILLLTAHGSLSLTLFHHIIIYHITVITSKFSLAHLQRRKSFIIAYNWVIHRLTAFILILCQHELKGTNVLTGKHFSNLACGSTFLSLHNVLRKSCLTHRSYIEWHDNKASILCHNVLSYLCLFGCTNNPQFLPAIDNLIGN